MDITELRDILNKIAPKWRARKIKENIEAISLLDKLYPDVNINSQINAILTEKSPYCVSCGKPLVDFRKTTCSITCRSTIIDHTSKIAKQKETLRKKYGVENIRQIPGAEDKRKSTMLSKYGKLVSEETIKKSRERAALLNIKGRKTLLKKYNVENPGQLANHYEKCVNTMLANSGVSHHTKTEKFIRQSEINRLENFVSASPAEIKVLKIHEPDDTLKENFNNPNYRIEFHCTTCDIIDIIPSETFKFRMRSTGTCCSSCGGLSTGSLKEKELGKFLEDLKVNIKLNDRVVIYPKEIDIVLPDFNLGIEFDGLYWHNDQLLEKNYHLDKTNLASKSNIKLIHVFEDEWVHKKEIVQARLRYMLNIIDRKIFARKCAIKPVTTREEKEFLIDNHIQGYAQSAIKIGLFYHDELVSLMTFSKLNISKGYRDIEGHWELLRFCSKKDVTIPGGASRLFKYFIKTYNPTQVISFSDKRWGDGEVYPKLGFTYAGDTPPNYWYIDISKITRIHRFSLRKTIHDDQSKTEKQLRNEQGYLRIWDCGSSKWVYTNRNGVD